MSAILVRLKLRVLRLGSKMGRKKETSSWSGMNKSFYGDFNTLSFPILKFSAIPYEENKPKTWEGTVDYNHHTVNKIKVVSHWNR